MSGWRAGLVAIALGGVVLAAGWILTRDQPADPTDPTVPPEAGVTLACPESFRLACDGLAQQLGLGRASFRTGQEIPPDTVVIGFASDLVDLTPTSFARSPIAIAVIGERAPTLERRCVALTVSCLVEQAGSSWEDLGAPSGWGNVALGLADPEMGVADLESWRLVAAENPPAGFVDSVRLQSEDAGGLMVLWVQISTRADAVVTAEVAIAAQLENFRNRASRLEVFYPDPTPFLAISAYGEGRAARAVVEQLSSPTIQEVLGTVGLRPISGDAQGLLDGLGRPGAEMTPLSPAEGPALVAKWDELVGG
ncbi:MAG: hypothetical protein ACT4OP_06585 [Actinomycetota bacterium]